MSANKADNDNTDDQADMVTDHKGAKPEKAD